MNRRRILSPIATALLVGAVLVLLLVGTSIWHKRLRQAAISVEIKVDILNYTAALVAFSNAFGSLPTGSNVVITPLLTGNNVGGIVFLHIPPQAGRINAFGEFTDPTGKPYMINVTSNVIQMSAQ